MRGHRVPYAAGSQFRHTHLQLAGRQHLIDNHLVDITLVGHLEASHMCYYGVCFCNFLVGISSVCVCGEEVEQCGVLSVARLEGYLAVAFAQIERLFVVQLKSRAVHLHDTLPCTYIEDTYLAAGQEMRCLQRVDSLQREHLAHGHSTAHNHTVVHRIHHIHLIGGEYLLNQEIVTQTCRVVTLCVNRVRRIANLIICLHVC